VRNEIDHLPSIQQGELDRVKQLLMGEFAEATARANQPWKKNGRILKVILFGSYARDDWVDEPENGYQSDYDLLIIVSHPDLTDIADYWYVAEDKILRDTAIARPVNIIVHTLQEVNQALSRGEYFWVDIARDGIVLYELPGSALATPQPLTAADAFEMASTYFQDWLAKVDSGIKLASFALQEGELKDAAFLLHQATERAYICYLLVRTLYFPRSHNIKFLRSLAEEQDLRLVEAFPRDHHRQRAWFNTINEAYVKARYSKHFEISEEALVWLGERTAHLLELVKVVCEEHIQKLERDVSRAKT